VSSTGLNRWVSGVFVVALVAAVGGCGGGSKGAAAGHGAAEAEQPAARPGRLSYGTVTSTVKKNQTTQAEVLDLFGGPNISTTDANGLETWVYERSASDTDTAGSSDARNLNAFFGAGGSVGGATVGGGVAGGASNTKDRSHTSNSVRNLTVIVKFNPDKTVRDYSVRQSTF
jgi:hypothetical protein